MSEKKDKRKKKSKPIVEKEEEEILNPSQNIITFDPATVIEIKLGQIVSLKNIFESIINDHPECKWTANEIMGLGSWLEFFNTCIRENGEVSTDEIISENID